jgi:hypothetical protein
MKLVNVLITVKVEEKATDQEVVELVNSSLEFLARLEPVGSAIVLPDRVAHPDVPDISCGDKKEKESLCKTCTCDACRLVALFIRVLNCSNYKEKSNEKVKSRRVEKTSNQ